MSDFIPVYQPDLSGREREYVLDCVDTSWISSGGQGHLQKFESAISEFTGVKHSIGVFNGTVALHLALQCLGVGPGDEVLVPGFTYIASVNAIMTTGAIPVLVESRRDDWLMDIEDAARKITPRTKAIMPVHLYGYACDMKAVRALADAHNLKIVEDAAEAMGVYAGGQHIGHLSDVATFSFFGNKTITCGEGGMVVTNDDALAEDLAVTKNHGMSTERRYWHDRLGFNYRMTHIQAAIGRAQLERIDDIIRRKKQIYNWYREGLAGTDLEWQHSADETLDSSYWLVSMLAKSTAHKDKIRAALKDDNIDSRPVFYCAHEMPMLSPTSADVSLPIGEDISARGFSLPSYPGLTQTDIERICNIITKTV